MSIQSVTGAATNWQVLAQLQAARGAADAPDVGATQASAWSGTVPGATAFAGTAAAPPPPPLSVLQFFQQLQSVDGTGSTATTDPAGQSDPIDSPVGGSAQGSGAVGTPQGQGAPAQPGDASVSNAGTADAASAATQTGNDLALQLLAGLQGGAWQYGLASLSG